MVLLSRAADTAAETTDRPRFDIGIGPPITFVIELFAPAVGVTGYLRRPHICPS